MAVEQANVLFLQSLAHDFAMDPLTSKGSKILHAMEKGYGQKKGEQVFYASKNKGTISGVDELCARDEIANFFGKDMSPEDWSELERLIHKFIEEEMSEEEHAEDGGPGSGQKGAHND